MIQVVIFIYWKDLSGPPEIWHIKKQIKIWSCFRIFNINQTKYGGIYIVYHSDMLGISSIYLIWVVFNLTDGYTGEFNNIVVLGSYYKWQVQFANTGL